jgi:BirA family biotin operon repressor/biotin-[acetyl-CoA-carboxylase] ligase
MPDALQQVGHDSQALQRLAEAWGISGIRFYNETDSTQNIVRGLAEAGAPAWTLVIADYQTKGRGQHGRAWRSAPGSSLMFSLLLRPRIPASMALLPIRTGMAVARAIDRLLYMPQDLMPQTRLKWPNDLMLGDGKVGGVLCEGNIRGDSSYAIIGIGINVHAFPVHIEDRSDVRVAFLDEFLHPDTTRLELLGTIIDALRRTRDLDSEDLSPGELQEYSQRDWLSGKLLSGPVVGRAAGITHYGHLVVDRGNGLVETVLAGRVSVQQK